MLNVDFKMSIFKKKCISRFYIIDDFLFNLWNNSNNNNNK